MLEEFYFTVGILCPNFSEHECGHYKKGRFLTRFLTRPLVISYVNYYIDEDETKTAPNVTPCYHCYSRPQCE